MRNILYTHIRILILFSFCLISVRCSNNEVAANNSLEYSLKSNWTYYEDIGKFNVDVFFIAPTVFMGDDKNFNLDMRDSITKFNFLGATNMEIGIYNKSANVFAPYYRQASLNSYSIRSFNDRSERAEINAAFDMAYSDVLNSFKHYLSVSDRPFILAGFSQGSEMLLRLMKEEFSSADLQRRLIAAYLIGWRITPDDYSTYQHLKPAKSEIDLGVIISFNTESPDIAKTIVVTHRTVSINPLSWSTDTNYADKSLNKGAVFTNYAGGIDSEVPNLTGAYICPNRGTLKVKDIDKADYPPILSIFQYGEYHIYDYLFFYRNLQSNVNKRIEEYQRKSK